VAGYATGVERAAPAIVPRGLHGFPSALASFVGRVGEVADAAGRLAEYRLVTITGPGGVGKTRLAAEVARRVAGRFADGVWLVELGSVTDPGLVPSAIAGALELRLAPGAAVAESLPGALAARQLLLVLDNCEHLLAAVASLCAAVLLAADDVRVLATSREPLGVAGEACYRLAPLGLPKPGDPAGTARSDAVMLFADRARRADSDFVLSSATTEVVAELVARLDGMPLAIELAAARVEGLGLAELAARSDQWLRLLAGRDRQAAARHRSLAAAVDWSYQLLAEPEQRVFRQVAAFPGAFTLAGAEAVAGAGAGAAVLRLVDCSLLVPPRAGRDGRARYVMLETLRGYATERLAEVDEQPATAARMADYALEVAEQAAVGLETSTGELAALRWLEGESATVHQGLAWAMEHDPPLAVRLALALAPWWWVEGRWALGYELLAESARQADTGGEQWCAAQFWLGLLAAGFTHTVGLEHYTSARDALARRPPSRLLCLTLGCRAGCLANLGRVAEADQEARHALALAREIGDPAGEVYALAWLAILASYSGDPEASLAWGQQAQRFNAARIPGWICRLLDGAVAEALTQAGKLVDAAQACARGLETARQIGDQHDQLDWLLRLAWVDLLAGRMKEATAHAREAVAIPLTLRDNLALLMNSLDLCGHLCAQSGRPAEAVTAWAAYAACEQLTQMQSPPSEAQRREEPLRKARQVLGPVAARDAEERGAAMAPTSAAEYVALLVAEEPGQPPGSFAAPGLPRLSARERELVTLVAHGRTDAQIADQLYISVRTVRSHLDRIRDKSGCRRRADLTRLALETGLV
jgi:predicted ATPase/DNA-binding CsgD family transcriptional regulator